MDNLEKCLDFKDLMTIIPCCKTFNFEENQQIRKRYLTCFLILLPVANNDVANKSSLRFNQDG
jgi:hypothetical protein